MGESERWQRGSLLEALTPARADLPALQPGDRMLFLTDGMLERSAGDVDIPGLMLAGARLYPREAMQ